MIRAALSSWVLPNYWHRTATILSIVMALFIPLSTFLTNGCIYLIFLIWLFDKNFKERWQFYKSYPLTKPIFCLIALSFVGTFYSLATWKTALLTCYHLVRLAWIPMLAYYLQDDRNKYKRWTLPIFVGAMMFTIACTVLKVYFEVPIGQRTYGNDVFKNHIVISYFMATALFFSLTWLLENKKNRTLTLFCIMSMLFYLLFLNTGRTGYVLLYSYLAVFAWYKYKIKGLIAILATLTLVLLAAYHYSDLFAHRISEVFQDYQAYMQGESITSVGKRLSYITNSLDIFFSHPFSGIGTGSLWNYLQLHNINTGLLSDNPHNQYLKIALELGLPGLIALMWLFSNQFKFTRHLSGTDFLLARGFFITFIFGCLFNSWFKNFSEVYFYCLITAYFVPHLYIKKGLYCDNDISRSTIIRNISA